MRALTIALGATMLATGLVPAGPAVAGPSGISGVTIGWTDGWATVVRITWLESVPSANVIRLETTPGGSSVLAETSQSDSNVLLVSARSLGQTSSRAATSTIVVEDSSGGSARSVPFDRYVPTGNLELAFLPGRAIRIDIPAAHAPDPTPDDPLDREWSTRWTPIRWLPSPQSPGYCETELRGATGDLPVVLPYPATSYLIRMKVENEWGGGITSYAEVYRYSVGISAPGSAYHGTSTSVFGASRVTTFGLPGTPPFCRVLGGDRPAFGVLWARRDARSPWGVVGSIRSSTGRFSFRAATPGTRQFRIEVPGDRLVAPSPLTGASAAALYGAVSETRTVVARTRVLSARFLDPTVSYRQRATAYLAVSPAGSQWAMLQYRTSSGAWRGLTYKRLALGRGAVTITWLRRGSTAFRWYVPASTTPSGWRVEAVLTRPFPLAVR